MGYSNKLFNLVMKKAIYLFWLLFFLSCGRHDEKVHDMEGLLELDKKVWAYRSLTQFNSFKLFRKEINNIEVCDSENSGCRPGEREYTEILKEIGVPTNEFDSLISRLDEVGYKTYHRYGDFSVWVKDGAFGDIYGHLVNHNPAITEIAPFKINNRYYVGVGKKVGDNIYYFSSNYY
jgi:hypothetical protein